MKSHLRTFGAAVLGSLLFGSASFGDESLNYAAVRVQVSVAAGPPPATDRPRPANYFQLAGAADKRLCDDVLKVFNEPGRFHGGDTKRWWLDNSHHIDFASMSSQAAPGTQYVFPDTEYTHVDLDGDGKDEHIYRLNSMRSDQWMQRLMIVPDELPRDRKLVTDAMIAIGPARLANEWMFTRQDVLSWVSEVKTSHDPSYVSPNTLRRNILGPSSAYWSLYKIGSRVVAVAVPPPFSFAPPELLVFIPSKERSGDLKCVLMPRAWPKPGVAE